MPCYQQNFVEPTLPQKVLCRRIDPEHEIGRMRSPRLTVSDLCSVHVSQQIFGQMRAGIPTQLKVFDCDPAAKRREQLSRSEERRVGKEWVRTCRSRWSPY